MQYSGKYYPILNPKNHRELFFPILSCLHKTQNPKHTPDPSPTTGQTILLWCRRSTSMGSICQVIFDEIHWFTVAAYVPSRTQEWTQWSPISFTNSWQLKLVRESTPDSESKDTECAFLGASVEGKAHQHPRDSPFNSWFRDISCKDHKASPLLLLYLYYDALSQKPYSE